MQKRRVMNGMEQLPQIFIEEILQRIGVESLLRFTSVSKQWNSMSKSTSFASRHLSRAQSQDCMVILCNSLELDLGIQHARFLILALIIGDMGLALHIAFVHLMYI